MVQRTLLAQISAPVGHTFPVPTHLGTAAPRPQAEYAATLVSAFGIGDSRDPPQFDLILLGLEKMGIRLPSFLCQHPCGSPVVGGASPPGTLRRQ